MTIAEFARSRNRDTQTISIYMRRHGMTYDRATGLTEDQLNILEEAYPLPAPIQVIEDTESKTALIKAQQKIIDLQEQLSAAREKAIALQATEYQMHLLEDAHKEQAERLGKAEAQVEADKTALDSKDEQINSLKDEINKLRSRTLWERIRNK